jgi:hypothetical protein
MMPISKLAWMAGVIDLKGKVVRKNNKMRKTQQLVLMVETKHLFITRELGSLTGTGPELQRPRATPDWMRMGCVEHCPEKHVHVARYPGGLDNMPAIARWTISGASMAVILDNLYPYLISDRQWNHVIDEVIEVTPLTGQGSGAVLKSLRRLADIGWEIPEALWERSAEEDNAHQN